MQKPVIVAPASSVSYLDSYKPATGALANVEQDHSVRPESIARKWIDKRLRSTSMAHGTLTLTVLDASVVQKDLPLDKSLKARLTSRQTEYELVGKLRWRLTYAGPMLASWSSEGNAEATSTVLEQSSLNEVDQAYADLIDGLAENFDQRMEQQVAALRRDQSSAVDATGH